MHIKVTPDMAEAIGIFVGDGYLRYAGSRKEVDISGNIEEKEYYDNHVVPLFRRIFGITINAKYFPSRNTYGIVTYNREIINAFKDLGFPSGAKGTIVKIPQQLFNCKKEDVYNKFLRGYN